jgi:glycosyltransferase involved in cell wall biosynthesis
MGSDALRTLVVVPAWNEERTVAEAVCEVREACPDVDVLVVDDGSWDETAAVASSAGARVCRLPFNLGVGGAMRAGYRYALRNRYDVVVQVDADGQHDPTYLDELVAALDHADVVIGARFAGEGDFPARGPRRWVMAMLAWLLSRLAGHRLCDVTSGFRAANRKAIAVFATYYPTEYLGDTVESLVIALRNGCRVEQVPVTMRVRAAGRASQPPARATVYLLRAVLALGLALVRRWPTAFADVEGGHS